MIDNYLILYKFSVEPQDQSGLYWTINRQFNIDPQPPKAKYVEDPHITPSCYKHSIFTQSANDG
ncbi:hypothetical protein UFOVP218_104 [uncultured Caudovirales phage]|uniref:Uncharacterized protein n=1 Tax=uncultured Caudovirales phage TaxID=2100421 RepID=A0A6J7WLV8_9CAUD|nr:hypothetical protein UFOVP218_104 [uncultured Caudovirales phage]